MDNYKSRYTSKEADLYGQDIFSGLNKMLGKKHEGLNSVFAEEVLKLTEAIYANKTNLNWDDIAVLQELSTKIYKIR